MDFRKAMTLALSRDPKEAKKGLEALETMKGSEIYRRVKEGILGKDRADILPTAQELAKSLSSGHVLFRSFSGGEEEEA